MNNTVELIGTYGSDLSHAQSAWTSTHRELTEKKRKRIPELLKYLAENGHETPFEKSALHFLVTSEIASHIHMLKHRISVSINAESSRYKELKDDKYYVPRDFPNNLKLDFIEWVEKSFEKYHDAILTLEESGMDRKRAKESARFFLPYANQIKCDIQFNFRSFVHFQRLRNDEHAQLEIREIAQQMLELVKETNKFEHTLKAFNL